MDPTALANQAIQVLSGYGARRAAGGQAEPAAESLYQLVARQLGASQLGQRMLQEFVAAPADPAAQAGLAAAITDQANRDPGFGQALAQALQPTQPVTGGFAGPVGVGQPRRFGIGTPGIVAIVAVVALLLIGGITVAVVLATSEGPYGEIAGAWVPETIDEESGTAVLRIEDDGSWTLDGFAVFVGEFSCSGEVTRDQPPAYTLTAAEGICPPASATLEGEALVVTWSGDEEEPERWLRQ